MATTDETTRTPLDLTRLTLGEVAKIEELSGRPLAAISDDDTPQGKLLAALVFVSERRNGHAIPWHECLNMEMTAALELLGMATPDEDDTDAEAAEGEAEGDLGE